MTLSELNEIIDHYNWDDGFEFPKKVLEYPQCYLALALRIFYLGDGFGYFKILQHNIGGRKEWLQFISTLYDDIASADM